MARKRRIHYTETDKALMWDLSLKVFGSLRNIRPHPFRWSPKMFQRLCQRPGVRHVMENAAVFPKGQFPCAPLGNAPKSAHHRPGAGATVDYS